MKKLDIKPGIIFIMICGIMGISNFSEAQQQETFTEAPGTVIELEGTSTLHGWTMESTDAEFSVSFQMDNGEVQSLNSLSFKLPVTSLKSGRRNLDNNAYEELNADQYPNIIFSAKESWITAFEDSYNIEIQGPLTIAGVTKEVRLEASCEQNGENLSCSGNQEINMTDFEIEPPTFMLGTMRVGEIVNINYTVQLEKEQVQVTQPDR